ncbi:MAG TPA: toll/interleukin-1 receptor domain-containing protein, partial [Haloferula sp.]
MPPRVFLSHNSRDKPAVNAIARRLVEAGVDCWYDAWDLTRGERWLPELQEALRELQACVIFYGPDGLGPWQQMEIEAITYAAGDARRTNRPFHVTPARLPDAPPWRELDLPPFLRERIQVDFPSVADNTAFLQLKLGIEGQASGPPDRLAGGRVPYVGLRPYREEDEGLFYGRDKEVAQLLTLLDKTGAPRFITLLGASGSGKSSLVFGGLLPDLREGKSLPGSKSWLRVTMQPGQIALNSLRDALKGQEPLARHVPVNDEAWQRPDTLQSVAMAALGNTDSNKRLLLVVDQFESLFTQQPAESSALHQYRERILLPFLRNLLHAAREPSGPITILLTARNDFFGTMVEDQWGLSEILDDHHLRLVLRSLEGESLRAVIERPATKLGVDFEEGLVEAVVEDFRIQASGSLPFLQEALVGIWMKRSSGQASASGERRPLLTLQSYIELGRLRGALNAHAEEVWQRVCQQPGLEGPARAILVHLVRLGDGGEPDTKRRVPIGDLPAAEPGRKAARFLAAPNARLLTLDTYGDLAGTATAELSHEALLAGWNRLNDWLNDHHQDGLKLRPDRLKLRRWEVAARLWQVRGEDAPDLLKSREIKAVELLAGKIPDEMPPQLASYLAESRRMRGRNRRNFATVVSLLTLVAVLGTLYIWNRTADSKFVEQLISESRSPGTSRELGFLLADEALKLAKTENHKREADHARLQASLDLGPCEKRFGASYLFGKIVPPELDSS